jgi:hypothetical protein
MKRCSSRGEWKSENQPGDAGEQDADADGAERPNLLREHGDQYLKTDHCDGFDGESCVHAGVRINEMAHKERQ